MKRIFLPFIIITRISLVLIQCEKNEDEKDIRWTNYTTSEGLVNDFVQLNYIPEI